MTLVNNDPEQAEAQELNHAKEKDGGDNLQPLVTCQKTRRNIWTTTTNSMISCRKTIVA